MSAVNVNTNVSEELHARKVLLTGELPQIDSDHRGRDLPPEVREHWLALERELDALETQISAQHAEAHGAG